MMIIRWLVLVLFCGHCYEGVSKPKQTHTQQSKKHTKQKKEKTSENDPTAAVNAILEPYGIEVHSTHALLVDYDTKQVLLAKNPDQPLEPASMTKIMTAYLVMRALKEGKVKPGDLVTTSQHAYSMEGSRMFLEIGQQVPIIDLLKGLIIVSGNDAAVSLAEFLGGTEISFATDMTRVAKEIGCKNTVFKNVSGLPQEGHYTTPADLIIMSMRIFEDFPEYYPIHRETSYTFNNTQENRNPLLYKNVGCDGIKTGHTDTAGFCLAASAEQRGRRLFLVCAGLKSMRQRAEESYRLLQWGFQTFGNYFITPPGKEILEIPVTYGSENFVAAEAAQSLLTLHRNRLDQLKIMIRYPSSIPAPIKAGQNVGEIVVSHPDWPTPQIIPLIAKNNISKAFFLTRIGQTLAYIFTKPGIVT